jgi:hypothetical protein
MANIPTWRTVVAEAINREIDLGNFNITKKSLIEHQYEFMAQARGEWKQSTSDSAVATQLRKFGQDGLLTIVKQGQWTIIQKIPTITSAGKKTKSIKTPLSNQTQLNQPFRPQIFQSQSLQPQIFQSQSLQPQTTNPPITTNQSQDIHYHINNLTSMVNSMKIEYKQLQNKISQFETDIHQLERTVSSLMTGSVPLNTTQVVNQQPLLSLNPTQVVNQQPFSSVNTEEEEEGEEEEEENVTQTTKPIMGEDDLSDEDEGEDEGDGEDQSE